MTFFFGIFVVYAQKTIFGAEFTVSTMGISASIMTLVNIFEWPRLLELTRSK